MKIHKITLVVNFGIWLLLSILNSGSGMEGVGFVTFIIGILDFIISIGFLFSKKKSIGITLLISGGILLLIGFSICTNNTLNIH